MDKVGKFAAKVASKAQVVGASVASKAHTGVDMLASRLKDQPSFVDKSGKRYRVKKLLSSAGRFGEVYLAEEELPGGAGGQLYALKRMPLNASNRADIKREISVMEKLNGHKNICRLEASIQVEGEVVLVLEFCGGGSILDLMNRTKASQAHLPQHRQGIPERDLLSMFLQVCEAVAHCHAQTPPIVHRDLKLENVLLQDHVCKLCDFGSATTDVMLAESESDRERIGNDLARNTTPSYRAPEMVDLFSRKRITEKSDVWALGCLLYKMAFEKDAFEEGSLAILNMRYTIPKFHPFSDNFIDLIKMCWVPDPDQRPDVGMVCKRVAEIIGVQTAASSFVAGQHMASTVPSCNPVPQAAPAARASPAPAAAGKDLFSMLSWESDASTPAKSEEPASNGFEQTHSFAAFEEQKPQDDFFASTPQQQQQQNQQQDFWSEAVAAPAPSTSPAQQKTPTPPPALQKASPSPQPPVSANDIFGWGAPQSASPVVPQQQARPQQPDLFADPIPVSSGGVMADILTLSSPASPQPQTSPMQAARKPTPGSVPLSSKASPQPQQQKSAAEIEASLLSWDSIKDSLSGKSPQPQTQQQQKQTLAMMRGQK